MTGLISGSDLPPVLLQPQIDWIADPDPFKICEKGRRTGMTWAEASDNSLIAASDKKAGGQNVYYIGTDKEMTEEYIAACGIWVKAFNYAASGPEEGIWNEGDDDDKYIKTYTIRFPLSGNKIVALASRPRKLRGRQGVLVGDEVAFQDDLAGLIKAGMAFLIWGGKVRLVSTHDGEASAFNELITDIRAGRRKGSVHRVTFMDAVNAGLYKRVCMRLGRPWSSAAEKTWIKSVYEYYGDDSAEELDCVPSQGSGVFLTRNLVESCMSPDIPVLSWEPPAKDFVDWPLDRAHREVQDWCEEFLQPLLDRLPKDARLYFGQDFGRSGDLSVIWPLAEMPNLDLVTPFTIELRNAPFRTQEQILCYLVDRLGLLGGGALDARGNGQAQAEYARQRYGAGCIAEVMLTEAWYRENMPPMKAHFEDRTIVIPKDRGILDDLRAFRMVGGVARLPEKRTTDRKGGQRHGDSGIALALAIFAVRECAVAPIAYGSVDPTPPGRLMDDAVARPEQGRGHSGLLRRGISGMRNMMRILR